MNASASATFADVSTAVVVGAGTVVVGSAAAVGAAVVGGGEASAGVDPPDEQAETISIIPTTAEKRCISDLHVCSGKLRLPPLRPACS